MSREQRIPFEVSIDPFYSDRNMAAIDEAANQIERGQVVVKTIDELEAMDLHTYTNLPRRKKYNLSVGGFYYQPPYFINVNCGGFVGFVGVNYYNFFV